MKCDNCHGPLNYHNDSLCHDCYHADAKELKRRKLLRVYHDKGKKK